MKQVWDSIRKAQAPSILEKLREQIKDYMERYKTSDDTDIVVRDICRELLTSLETKEEPAHYK